jgi:hypothetical protein
MALVSLPYNDRPLCPHDLATPANPAHQLHNRLIDAVHEATPHDEDGQPVTPELEAVAAAVTDGRVSARMRLHREAASGTAGGAPFLVEAWFFRCDVCGLILPAGRVASA